MSTLDQWTDVVCADLGIDRPDPKVILDLAREVAHAVDRPAAPLTAYLAGVAVGRGLDPAEVIGRVIRLALDWAADHPESELPGSYGTADAVRHRPRSR